MLKQDPNHWPVLHAIIFLTFKLFQFLKKLDTLEVLFAEWLFL